MVFIIGRGSYTHYMKSCDYVTRTRTQGRIELI